MKQKLLEMIQVTVQILFILMKLINQAVSNNVKKCMFWGLPPSFSDFIKTKQIWNSNLNQYNNFCFILPPFDELFRHSRA